MSPEPAPRKEKDPDAGGRRRSRFLALIPISVAVLLGSLVLPRSAPPHDVPLPVVDTRVIRQVRGLDHARAERARATPLNGDARALGSAIREFNTREAKDDTAAQLAAAREAINTVLPSALAAGMEDLLALRAFQMERFLEEVRAFEVTGQETDELGALAGTFLVRLRLADWSVDHEVLLTDDERRVAFKLAWNGVAGVDRRPEFALALDETRVLYTLFLRLPHLAEATKDALDRARHNAKDPAACSAVAAGTQLAIEAWRYEKIKKFGAIDPSYPLAYALGVSHFLRAQYPASAESFRDWLQAHPRGPLTLRATNHLKAALEASAF